MKRIISYVLLLCMILTAVPISAEAAEKRLVKTGKGDDGIYWNIYNDGTLQLYGFGEMENHLPAGGNAWGGWIYKNIAAKTNYTYSVGYVKHAVVDTGIRVIGDCAFASCRNNLSAHIGSGVEIIGGWAFLENNKLQTVYIPKSVKTIYSMAFYNCDSLTDVYYGGTKEQWDNIKISSNNEDLLNAKIHYEQDEYVGDYINSEKYKPANVKGVLSAGNEVKISWKKVSSAKGYNVYHKKSTESDYTEKPVYTTSTSKTIDDLAAETKYTFKVVPCFTKSKIESSLVTEVEVTTLPVVTGVSVEEVSSSKVKVTWDKANGVDGYQISKSTKKTGTNSIGSTTNLSKTTEVSKNKTYYYKVRAYKKVDGNKVYTPWTEAIAYNLRYVYSASNVKATLVGGDDVKVSWNKTTGANAYDIYVMIDEVIKKTSRTSELKQEFKDLDGGVKYTFKVVPLYVKDDTVIKGKEKTTSVTTLKKIDKPVITTSGDKVKISWNNILNESGYQISKTEKPEDIDIVSTYKTTKGSYKSLTAKNDVTYYYKVRAYKTVNGKKVYGDWSEAVAHTVIPVVKKGTYEADYGSTKYILKVKEVTGNEVKFQLLFAGRYASGKSNVITEDAENDVIEFDFKDYNAKGKVIGKGKGTLVFKNGTIVLNTVATSGNTQLSTNKKDEVLNWVNDSTK